MFHGDICTVNIITCGLLLYGHFNDVILNWHQVYSIGGATHTYTIAQVPMLFYVKKKLLTYKSKNRADCINGKYACVLWPGSTKKNGQLRLFFLVFWWWFAVVCGGLPASSLVTHLSSQILVVVCGGLR